MKGGSDSFVYIAFEFCAFDGSTVSCDGYQVAYIETVAGAENR